MATEKTSYEHNDGIDGDVTLPHVFEPQRNKNAEWLAEGVTNQTCPAHGFA